MLKNQKDNYSKIINELRKIKIDLGYKGYDIANTLKQQFLSPKIINHKEIRIIGLKRSGNHAIINWIRQQETGEVWHINNVPVYQNPYRFLYSHYKKENLRQEAIGNFTVKDCLMYSYEDQDIQEITNPIFEKKHDIYLGKSENFYDVLILRDPYNFLASRLHKKQTLEKNNQLKPVTFWTNPKVMNLWIAYAKEFIGETNYLKSNKVCINYNQWFTDIDYRKNIASQLNLEFSDLGFNKVKGQGGGSSFDRLHFDGKASQMKVLERWKLYIDDFHYLKLINNPEILHYSQLIFQELPDLEILLKKLK